MSDHRLRLAWAGLHPDRSRQLLGHWGGARAVVRAIERGQVKAGEHVRRAVAAPAAERRAELAELGVRFEVRDAAPFPARLAALPDCPDAWFVRGRMPEGSAVAVVGTRRCSAYGKRLARAFGRAIVTQRKTRISRPEACG